jgi:GNAT superfamily N-acetyltransferase
MFSLRELSIPLSGRWLEMTFPAFRSLLKHSSGDVLVIGATAWMRPAGLCVARLDGTVAEILSIYVAEPWRRLGCAREMIRLMERKLAARGIVVTHLSFSSSDSDCPVHAMICSAGWEVPEPYMLLVNGERERIAQMPWHKAVRERHNLTLFPWAELTARDRECIEKSIDAGEIPEALTPFGDDEFLVAGTSLGLRHRDQVVGWQVNHCLTPNVHRFTATWVDSRWSKSGTAIWLMSESIRRYVATGVPFASMGVQIGNTSMLAFFERRIRPYISTISICYRSQKEVTPDLNT